MASKSVTPKKAVDTVKVIRLPNPYNGVPSNYAVIQPGIYQIDDEKLLGLGEYLVRTFHASVVNEVEREAAPEPDAESNGEGKGSELNSTGDQPKV